MPGEVLRKPRLPKAFAPRREWADKSIVLARITC
jgi:hypothetical protein